MPHDRDPRSVLNPLDETVATTGNDEVDIAILSEERSDFVSSRDSLDVRRREEGGGEGCLDDGRHDALRVERFLASFENCSVPCRKRSYSVDSLAKFSWTDLT